MIAHLAFAVALLGCGATAQVPSARIVESPAQIVESPVQPADHYVFDGDEYLRKVAKVQGMTVENAKHYLAELGHTGEIFVTELYKYDEACAQHRVCSYSIVRKPEDDLKLWVNRSTTITAPSP